MFIKIFNFIKNNIFCCLLISCVLFIIILGIINKLIGKKGSWSKSYYYNPNVNTHNKNYNNINMSQPKKSKGELECKRVLEHIFQKPFLSVRPDFLRNNVTGGNYNLELDCFNEELKLACEYNGIQHYKFTPFFHKNNESFLNQKYRDDMKRRICKDNNITLIEVPYYIKHHQIKDFIISKLKSL